MSTVYLMQRFDMNRLFPNPGPNGIEAYVNSSFVLFDEKGVMIPLARGFGNASSISPSITRGLRALQDRGYEIRGDIHPLFDKPIDIAGDVEHYKPFPVDSAEELAKEGVRLVYEDAA